MPKQNEPLMELHREYLRLLKEKTGLGLMILESRYTEYRIRKSQLSDIRIAWGIYDQLAEFTKKQFPELSAELSGKSSQILHEAEQCEANIEALKSELSGHLLGVIEKLQAAPNPPRQNHEESH